MPLKSPEIHKCCGCITDLKSAVIIIAVLGIVTSPAVSWAIVRHSYVVRVSCFITTSETRPDIIDINLNNIISFGFGANAGLGPSCLSPKKDTVTIVIIRDDDTEKTESKISKDFIATVKYFGWFVLLADIIFVCASIHFLRWILKGGAPKAAKIFMWTAAVSSSLSLIYGMMYVGTCITVGGAFPIYEFAFCIIDAILWIYFIIVVYTYIRKTAPVMRDERVLTFRDEERK